MVCDVFLAQQRHARQGLSLLLDVAVEQGQQGRGGGACLQACAYL
jgi:hypothetical protein